MSTHDSGVDLNGQDRKTGVLGTVLELALVALAYWLTARLSLQLALVHGQVTPIWPPTGIALVSMLVFGRRVWPAVFVAALAVNLPIGPSPVGAALIAAGNTLAPLAAALFLQRAGFRIGLDRLRDAVAIIVLGALVSMTISATIGSSVLVLSGSVPGSTFWSTWAVWWTGDAMGVLLVAPFLLALLSSTRSTLPLRTAAELAVLLVGVGVVTYALFQNRMRLEYLVFPLIILAAWRFRLRGAAPAALIASGVAIWAAAQGTGPFGTENLLQKMITLQVFNVCVAVTSLVLTTFVESHERAEEMTRLYVAANAASQAKSAFLHMAAHELRTPLTVLSGYLSLLLSDGSVGSPPDAWLSPLGILAAKTRELERIVDDLLTASGLEVNNPRQEREVIDLRKVVENAVERVRPRADLLAAEVIVELPQDPAPVEADPAKLGRVLDDLLNNAPTYTTRIPRVRIALSTRSQLAIVHVEDNGVGISQEDQDRVFDRLYRVADSQVVVPGIGLGLYIARQLARSSGGTLVVESSTTGVGTVFGLSLPLSRKAAASELQEAEVS
jgi:signal transduction histidine kinase